MTIWNVVRTFERYSCAVYGAKGTGKDVLFGNVINRRKLPYISNTDYGGTFYPYETEKISCGGNTYRNFLDGSIKKYRFPYPEKTDLYLADVGVYFPSQYCNELNRDYKSVPVYEALSRHLGNGSKVHYNTQAISRCWDKLREQCEVYIKCLSCKVLFGKIVIQRIRCYEKYSSANENALPWRVNLPLLASREMRLSMDIAKQKYYNTYGRISEGWLIYWNKSNHDSRAFKSMLEGDSNE